MTTGWGISTMLTRIGFWLLTGLAVFCALAAPYYWLVFDPSRWLEPPDPIYLGNLSAILAVMFLIGAYAWRYVMAMSWSEDDGPSRSAQA